MDKLKSIQELKQEIHQFIMVPCSDEDNLIETGLLSSLEMVDLIVKLESKYKVRIEIEDFIQGELNSINKIANFIASRSK